MSSVIVLMSERLYSAQRWSTLFSISISDAPPPASIHRLHTTVSQYRMMSLLRKEDTHKMPTIVLLHIFNRCRAQSIAVDAEPVFDAPEDLRG